MELRAEKVAAAQRGAELPAVIGAGDRRFADLRRIRVDVIDVGLFVDSFQQRSAQAADGVPAYMGNLQPVFRGFQPPDVRRENPQTAGVSLLAVETQQLHADADAQYGLRQGGDDQIESPLAEFGHRRRSFAHAGQQHPVGAAQERGIGRDREFGPGYQ